MEQNKLHWITLNKKKKGFDNLGDRRHLVACYLVFFFYFREI